MVKLSTTALGLAALLCTLLQATPLVAAEKEKEPTTTKGTNPLVIRGYRFFDSVTGTYVPIRGVNYYPRPNTGDLDKNNLDLFTSKYKHIWSRDIPQFVALGANAIRLYAVDPDQDHREFMCMLQSAGIYVIVDMGSEGCEITPDPAPACYSAAYRERGEKIITTFAQYDNVIAFSGGNEVNHRTGGHTSSWNAPCQKKFVRDMREFISKCSTIRKIPVGLVVADTERDDNAKYYNCRTDPTDPYENAEWYGINSYVHCTDSTDPKVGSGFDVLKQSFESYKYSIPTIITEYGCTSDSFPTVNGYGGQRTFHDAKWMNERRYSDFFNGGFAFEYSTENANCKSTVPFPYKKAGPQNYGLGYFTPENCDDITVKCTYVRFPNFDSLAEAYKSTTTSDEPTISSFNPAKDRLNSTTCPAWPKLKDFKWQSDSHTSICPQVHRYQCPNVPIPVITTPLPTSKPVDKDRDSPESPIPDDKTESKKDDTKGSKNDEKKEITVQGSTAPSTLTTSLTAMLASATMLVLMI